MAKNAILLVQLVPLGPYGPPLDWSIATNLRFANKRFFWTVIQSKRLFAKLLLVLTVKLWSLNNTAVKNKLMGEQYHNLTQNN